MADKTEISWSDATWNIITGCSVKSAGCTNCYAMKLAGSRLRNDPSRAGLTQQTKAGPVWTGDVRFNEKWLTQPLHWKKPRRIFVCAHGDLFHENVPDEWIDRIFAVMALCQQHTFQVLTKRSDRMRRYLTDGELDRRLQDVVDYEKIPLPCQSGPEGYDPWIPSSWPHSPPRNVWLGVSVEDQRAADERIPDLLATPAALRWTSAEPLLGQLDISRFFDPDTVTGCADDGPYLGGLDWVVAGGESGPNARGSAELVEGWMRDLKGQCDTAGVAFHGKQNFRKQPLPDDLDVKAFPGVAA